MDELLKSLSDWIKERSSGTFYSAIFISLLILEWKKFYVLFWSSSTPEGMTRLEYARQQSITYFDIPNFILFNSNYLYDNVIVNSLVQGLFDVLLLVIPITVLTYIFIKVLPVIHHEALSIGLDQKFSRLLLSDQKRSKYLEEKEKIINKTLNKVKTIESKEKKIKTSVKKIDEEILNEEERWIEDYNKKNLEPVLKSLSYTIYEHSGKLKRQLQGYTQPTINSDMLAIAESNSLVTFSNDRQSISFTKKGLFLNGLTRK